MRAMPNEPSMEEILSSIKRIIAEEDIPAQGARAPRRAAAANARVTAEEAEADAFADDDQILELTDALPGEAEATHEETVMAFPAKPGSSTKPTKAGRARTTTTATSAAAPAPASEPVAAVMSDTSADAARESLVNLSKLLLKPEDGQANTVEGLVREMLRPMLKDWLDTHLPGLVETMVKREIDRITGRV